MNDDDTPESSERKSPTIAARLRGMMITLLILATLWVGVRYVLGPMLVAQQGYSSTATDVVQLKQRVTNLEKALAALEQAADSAPTPATTPAPTAVIDLTPLEKRLEMLEAHANQVPTAAPPAIVPDTEEIERIKADLQALKQTDHAYIRSLILIGQLHSALREGRTFSNELDALQQLRPDMAKPLSALSEYAKLGVPTLAFLKEEFKQSVDRALRKETGQPTLASNMRSLIKIRKVGEHDGKDDEAIIARTEARIAEGKLEAALVETASLSQASAQFFAAWREHAKAHLVTQQTLADLTAALAEPTAP